MTARVSVIGRSVEGRPVCVYHIAGRGRRRVLILGAMHGDEPKTVFVARHLIEHLGELLRADGPVCSIRVVPLVNPDGYARRRRTNANSVDLNRNFPTADWVPGKKRSRYYGGPSAGSEPETMAIVRLVRRFRPEWIISLHSIDRQRQCNNYNGEARDLARRLSRFNGYPVTSDIGYPTPGSFGTWAGVEQHIPTVTLELPSHTSRQRDWRDNREALLAVVDCGRRP